MRDARKQERHHAITHAAYDLIAEKGYAGTSMLNIAKAAKASNETLYRWYGDKRGLFEAMVQDNAAETEALLKSALDDDADPMESLKTIAPIFLAMLLGDRAILLNRAAAADATGELGLAISQAGRDVIAPLFAKLIAALPGVGADDVGPLTQAFIHLLIGDRQIKRAIGVEKAPTSKDIDAHCANAFRHFQAILAAK
ncbi:MAG: TetR/AcrR family transcriptional regulator [Pseudomonadota bacterium]|nr:TetR/AcrR family transcriptional regulator [Pseudomonadota bacterium]